MTEKKKAGMTREQAAKLYDDLKAALEQRHGKQRISNLIKEESKKQQTVAAGGYTRAAGKGGSLKAPLSGPSATSPRGQAQDPALLTSLRRLNIPSQSGANLAILFVAFFALSKVAFNILDYSGIFAVPLVKATQVESISSSRNLQSVSREEAQILKSLDARRSELEDRARKLDQQGSDLDRRDREFAARLTELRDLSEQLKGDREKSDKKRSGQMLQLANIYSSMNPEEAAHLLEQLDVTISLNLIERMPEKRIGQILSLMSPQKALTLTQMLSRGKS